MKFAQQLKALEGSAAPEWRGKFIHYKELKKAIKLCRKVNEQGDVEVNGEAQFFRQLEAEVRMINQYFEKAAREVLAASEPHCSGKAGKAAAPIGCFSFLRKPKPLGDLSAAELSAASTWCRQYAVVNATGLRKIAKKHDKRCGGTAGSQFLQRCWDCGHLQWGSFLHSPLLDELKALEQTLNQRSAAIIANSTYGRVRSSGSGSPSTSLEAAAVVQGSPAGSGDMSPEPCELNEEAMMCPICMEPMHLPLGLACGHKACLECALEAAGLQHMKGRLSAVLLNAPRAAQCFQCRQPGMFNRAVHLKQLGAAIQRRFPEEIAEAKKRTGATTDRNI